MSIPFSMPPENSWDHNTLWGWYGSNVLRFGKLVDYWPWLILFKLLVFHCWMLQKSAFDRNGKASVKQRHKPWPQTTELHTLQMKQQSNENINVSMCFWHMSSKYVFPLNPNNLYHSAIVIEKNLYS